MWCGFIKHMAMTSRSRGLIRMFVVKCWEMRIAHFVGKLCDIWLDIMIKRGMTVGPYFQIDPYCKVASQKYWCWGLFCLVIYQRQCLKLTIAGVMGQGWGSVPARSWLMVDSPSKTGHFSSTPVGNGLPLNLVVLERLTTQTRPHTHILSHTETGQGWPFPTDRR